MEAIPGPCVTFVAVTRLSSFFIKEGSKTTAIVDILFDGLNSGIQCLLGFGLLLIKRLFSIGKGRMEQNGVGLAERHFFYAILFRNMYRERFVALLIKRLVGIADDEDRRSL